jgi:hypothetical protein
VWKNKSAWSLDALLTAPEPYVRVLVLRIETELVVGALAFVVGVPGTASD